MKNLWALLLSSSVLAACTQLAGETVAPTAMDEAPRAEVDQLQWLLAYSATLKGRSTTELNAELELLNRSYAQHKTEANRLRLAIYHSVATSGDRARALALLDVPSGEGNGRGRSHPIAQMLIPLLQDYRKTDDALTNTIQKLRDEQKRGDALQQKLDALRDVEKRMLDRSKAP